MELYLLRHSDAEPAGIGIGDRDRKLTENGIRKIAQVAKTLQTLRIEFDVLLSSPLVRCVETASYISKLSNPPLPIIQTPTLLYDSPAIEFISLLKKKYPANQSVIAVGHAPHLGELATLLTTGSISYPLEIKKGGIIKIKIDSFSDRICGKMEWLIPPKILRLG